MKFKKVSALIIPLALIFVLVVSLVDMSFRPNNITQTNNTQSEAPSVYPDDFVLGYFTSIIESEINALIGNNASATNSLLAASQKSSSFFGLTPETSSTTPGQTGSTTKPTNIPPWCTPPNAFIPIAPPSQFSPGLCIKPVQEPQKEGVKKLEICFRAGDEIFCYRVTIKCSSDPNKPCTIEIIRPIPFPSVKCKTLPREPLDPEGLHRLECTINGLENKIKICYRIDPHLLTIVPAPCPSPYTK